MNDEVTPYPAPTPSSDELEDVYTSPESYAGEDVYRRAAEDNGGLHYTGADGELLPESAGLWQKPKPKSKLGWFRRLFPGSAPSGLQARLWDLDQTISAYPDSPSNYVVRGEIYLDMGEAELAYADFSIAWKLATEQIESANWGLIAQAMQNRAEAGLAEAQRRMARRER